MIKASLINDTEEKQIAWNILLQTYRDFESVVSNYQEYKDKVFQNAVFIKGTANGNIVGVVAFYANNIQDKIAYVSQIAVLPSAQRKGIGAEMLKQCEIYCKSAGMKKLKLEVKNENITAISFYCNKGFSACGDASEHSQYMIKGLS